MDAVVIPGMINLELPRKVCYSKRKKNPDQYIKVDKYCRVERTYEYFLAFIKLEENKYLLIVQIVFDRVKIPKMIVRNFMV